MDPSALPVATAPPAAGRVEGAGEGVPGDYQETLRQAHAAKESGALERAEQLFRSVLAKNPGDSEALAGLGDVARLRGDKGGSATYYEQVTKQNPSYLPALIGLADAKWEAGDKAGAVALYRQVLDKVGGQGAYATRARQRIAAATQAGTSEPAPSSTAGKAHPTATATSQNPSVPPGVDTSDLPGWKP
jgi:tetratricopeptide (TPR) repeat protein